MSDVEIVRGALNSTSDEVAWDAFNRILMKNAELVKELRASKDMCANTKDALRTLYGARIRNGTHGIPPMVSVDEKVWREIGTRFEGLINAK